MEGFITWIFFCIIIPHKRSGSLFTAQNLEKVLDLSNHQNGALSDRYIWQTEKVEHATAFKNNYLDILKVHFKIPSDKLQILFQGIFHSKLRFSAGSLETLVTEFHRQEFCPIGKSHGFTPLVWRHHGAQRSNLTLTKKPTQLSPRRLFIHVRGTASARAQLPVFTCSWRTLRRGSLRAGGGQLLW